MSFDCAQPERHDAFSKIVERFQDMAFGYAYSVLGVISYKQGKYDQAINALTKSLAFNPKNAEAHNYLGITCPKRFPAGSGE